MGTSAVDIYRLRALDVETPKTDAGVRAPRIIVGSTAELSSSGAVRGSLLSSGASVLDAAESYLRGGYTIVNAYTAFDMVCLAARDSKILPLIFQAYREGRILSVDVIQVLDAIFGGHLEFDPRSGANLRNPATGKETKRYALSTVVDLVLGRTDAKESAAWRMSYALLEHVPRELWPPEALQYPVDDTNNALEVALAQLRGWERGRLEPGVVGPARNFSNAAFQCEVAFCLQLGAAWSLRTDLAKVEALAVKVEKLHAESVERFKKFGWRREDGTEDQVAVKKAVCVAYGVHGTCKRCSGSGKIRREKKIPCRGPKVSGRYQGCGMQSTPAIVHGVFDEYVNAYVNVPRICGVCRCTGEISVFGNEVTCLAREGGCDGSGFDLSTAPYLPRTETGGISTDRGALMESGDDELSAYGEDEFEKTRSTYLPYLRSGTVGSLKLVPNVLVASGRLSYEGGVFHQLPRHGGERETIVARPGRVLGSTDYEAGELCSLGQYCFWIFRESGIRDAINASGKPGILHSELAASVLGIPIDEFLVKLKAKDQQCVDFRQASKPINFGTPGGMGSAKLVWTSRKKNAGFTFCENGPHRDSEGRRGYVGIRFCILIDGKKRCGSQMITRWKERDTYPVCKDCVTVVEHVLRAAYFKRFPEIRRYFRWVSDRIEKDGRVPCLVWNAERGEVEIIRWRGGVDFSSGCNNGFQALLADVMKLAYVRMTREGYLGVREDGTPSPLAGCRFPVVMHDEPISELFEETAHLSGPRIGEISEEAGRQLAPDVVWRAETAIARYLSKGMEPVYHPETKQLMIWEPKAA